jgi:hypothetical protein
MDRKCPFEEGKGQEVSAEKLLIKAQSMHDCLEIEEREWFSKDIGALCICDRQESNTGFAMNSAVDSLCL